MNYDPNLICKGDEGLFKEIFMINAVREDPIASTCKSLRRIDVFISMAGLQDVDNETGGLTS